MSEKNINFAPDFKISSMPDTEINEIFNLLALAGIQAELCDTLVPVSSCSVRCGKPTMVGDDDRSEYIMLPKSLVGLHPQMLIPVDGESMLDAGFAPGDLLRIEMGKIPSDGDNALVCVDGECTVKALFTDLDGSKWLVARNNDYDAIPLTKDKDVRVLGVVMGVEKKAPRASTRTMMEAVRRTKQKQTTTDASLDQLVKSLQPSTEPTNVIYANNLQIENNQGQITSITDSHVDVHTK